MTESAAAPLTQPARIFMMGSIRLADPAPALDPLEALRLYLPNYPQLAHATLAPPEIINGEVVYRVEKPPVGTKG